MSDHESIGEIARTLREIKERKDLGYQKTEEHAEAIADLAAAMEKVDKFMAGDEAATQAHMEQLTKAFEPLLEKQLEARFEAMKGKFDLLTNDRIMGRIDATGFKLEQKMLMRRQDLSRYFQKDMVSDIRTLQNLRDEALIVGHIMFHTNRKAGDEELTLKQQIAQTNAFKQFKEFYTRAMDSATTAEGLELIPTDFSAQILDVVAINLKLFPTFPSLTMPASPFKLPVATSDDVGFKAPESLTDSFLTEANKIAALTPGTTNVTFTAQKAGALAVFSEEVREDAVIAVVPFLREKLGNSIGNAIERAILDGDTTGTHMDNDVSAATDARKLWNGIRKDVVPDTNGVDLATLDLTNVRSLRKKLAAEFAEDPEQLVYAVSVDTMLKVLEFPEFVTVDKFGPNATILRGQIGRIDNIPVLTSKYVRTDVHATGVNTTGESNDKGVMYLYNRNAYMWGSRRAVTLKFGETIWTDQGLLVATMRGDFQKLRAGKVVAAVGKNLTVG